MSKLALLGGKKAIEKEFAPYTSLGEKEKKITLKETSKPKSKAKSVKLKKKVRTLWVRRKKKS